MSAIQRFVRWYLSAMRAMGTSWFQVLASFAVTAPVFLTALSRVGSTTWSMQGDVALAALRALDVGKYTPQVGVYSRYNWAHPGPAYFFLLAPALHIGRDLGVTLAYYVVLVKWACTALATFIVWRRVSPLAAVGVAGATSAVSIYAIGSIWDAWNPIMTMTPFLLMLVVVLFTSRDRWALIAVGILGSSLIQIHIALLFPVSSLVLVFAAARTISRGTLRKFTTRWEAARFVGSQLVLWLLPVRDQLFRTRNASTLFDFFIHNSLEKVGFSDSLHIVAHQVKIRGPWNGINDVGQQLNSVGASLWWYLLPIGACLLLAYEAFRHDSRLKVAACAIPVMIVTSIISIAQITDFSYSYLFFWLKMVIAVMWALTAYVVVRNVQRALSRYDNVSWIAICGSLCVGVFAISSLHNEISHRVIPMTTEMAAIKSLGAAANRIVNKNEPVTMKYVSEFPLISEGVAFEIEHAGRDFYMEPINRVDRAALIRAWGEHRVRNDLDGTVLATVQGGKIAELIAEGWKLESIFDPMNLLAGSQPSLDTSPAVFALLRQTSVN